jgi:hypothetical protein
MSWERIVEARVQEWLNRPAKERERPASEGPVAPLEVQLLHDVLGLLEEARSCDDDAKAAGLRRQADAIQTRLMVVLEDSGRPLTAQHFARVLQEARLRR